MLRWELIRLRDVRRPGLLSGKGSQSRCITQQTCGQSATRLDSTHMDHKWDVCLQGDTSHRHSPWTSREGRRGGVLSKFRVWDQQKHDREGRVLEQKNERTVL